MGKTMIKKQLLQVAIAFDQFINTLFGGMADETISSRAYRLRYKNKFWGSFKKFIDLLFFFQKDHCYKSYISEINRRHLPDEFYCVVCAEKIDH